MKYEIEKSAEVGFSALEYESERSVLLLFDVHVRTEDTRFYGNALGAYFFCGVVVKELCAFGKFGGAEVG